MQLVEKHWGRLLLVFFAVAAVVSASSPRKAWFASLLAELSLLQLVLGAMAILKVLHATDEEMAGSCKPRAKKRPPQRPIAPQAAADKPKGE